MAVKWKINISQLWESLEMPAEQFESISQEVKFYGIHFLSEKGGNLERYWKGRKLCRIGKNKSKWSGNTEVSSEATAERRHG